MFSRHTEPIVSLDQSNWQVLSCSIDEQVLLRTTWAEATAYGPNGLLNCQIQRVGPGVLCFPVSLLRDTEVLSAGPVLTFLIRSAPTLKMTSCVNGNGSSARDAHRHCHVFHLDSMGALELAA